MTNTGIRRIAMLVVHLDVKINNVMPSMDPVYMDAPVQMHYHPVAVSTVKSTKWGQWHLSIFYKNKEEVITPSTCVLNCLQKLSSN